MALLELLGFKRKVPTSSKREPVCNLSPKTNYDNTVALDCANYRRKNGTFPDKAMFFQIHETARIRSGYAPEKGN